MMFTKSQCQETGIYLTKQNGVDGDIALPVAVRMPN